MPSVPSHVSWGFVSIQSGPGLPLDTVLAPWRRYCTTHCEQFSLVVDGQLTEIRLEQGQPVARQLQRPRVLKRLPPCPLAEADTLEDLLGTPALFGPGVAKSTLQDFGHLRRTVSLDRLVSHLDGFLSTIETGQSADLRFLIDFHSAASYAQKYGLLLAVPWPAGRTKAGTPLAGRGRRR